MPLIAGGLALAGLAPARPFQRGSRVMDAALVLAVLVPLAQLVPVNARTRVALSPGLERVEAALYFDEANPGRQPAAPLTVDRAGTEEALALAVGLLAFFWGARGVFKGGGTRQMIFVVAVFGIVASAVAILQHATAPNLLYWVWRPLSCNARPFSPFVNKNDLAAWLVMAGALASGYFVARVDARRRDGVPAPFTAAMDDRAIWLVGGLGAMAAALIVTLSRSGATAAAAGAVMFVLLSRDRLASRGRAWLVAGIAALGGAALAYGNGSALIERFNQTLTAGVGSRREIWAATGDIIRDFPIAGVGVGGFERAMSVYQPPHVFAFNHAHDAYLQILAEGGLVLGGLMAVAFAAGGVAAVQILWRDRTPSFWLRAGAASGIVAIMIQNIWETALRMPANAVLFALSWAILLQPYEATVTAGGTTPGRR